MRSPMPRIWWAVALPVGLWACAGNPGPGASGYPFNVSGAYRGEIVVQEMPFGAELQLTTEIGGAVTGTYQVVDPISMSGSLTGSLAQDSISFNLGYVNPSDGCSGTLEGLGTVAQGGVSLAGRVFVDDSCSGPLDGTFRFRRAPGSG